MALTDAEQARVRYHLGYTNIDDPFAMSLGVPQATQFQFTLELNFAKLAPEGEPFVRRCIHELDCIEQQLSDFRQSLEFKRTGTVEYRGSEAFAELDIQYKRWRAKLSDALGTYPNPTSILDNQGALAGGVVEPTGY
jgi:hypothetical protein